MSENSTLFEFYKKCIINSFCFESSTIMEKDLQGLRSNSSYWGEEKLNDEAEVEPNFLFMHSFHGDSHFKMSNSL